MKSAAILAILLAATMPVMAAEHGQKGESASGEKKGGKPGTNVDMPYLMAPLTNDEGKLTGYAYISTRLTAASDAFALAVREKLPFLQDAFVRDINATGVAMPGDPEKVDIAAVEKRLMANANKVMGAGKVKLITICTVQISELRPAQALAMRGAPQTRSQGLEPPKNPEKSRCAN